jgi:hypothetical protein
VATVRHRTTQYHHGLPEEILRKHFLKARDVDVRIDVANSRDRAMETLKSREEKRLGN